MTTPVGPYTLTGIGTPLNVPVPPGQFTQLVIDNASPYTCAVNIGGPQHWLAAFTSDVYDIAPGASVDITPNSALTGASTDATVTATFYRPDETPNGTYPVSLTSQAVVAALTGTVIASILGTIPVLAQQELVASGAYVSGTPINITGIPPWTRKLVLIASSFNSGSYVSTASLVGGTSGNESLEWSAGGANPINTEVLLAATWYGSVDPTGTLQINTSGGTTGWGGLYWLVADEANTIYGAASNPQNEQVTAALYSDGSPSMAVSAPTVTANVQVPLVAAPPAGFLTRIASVIFVNGTASQALVQLNGVSGSAFPFAVLVAGTSFAFTEPFSTPNAVTGSSNIVGVGLYVLYSTVPLRR